MTSLYHYAALATAILMTIGAQIVIKIGARRSESSLNMATLSGLAMFGLVTVLMVLALQGILLKTAIAMSALTFIGTPLAARVFLGEELTRQGLVASLVIVVGIVVFLAGG